MCHTTTCFTTTVLYNTDESNKNVMFLVIFVCTSFRIHRYVGALSLNSTPFKEMAMGWTCKNEKWQRLENEGTRWKEMRKKDIF